MYVGTYKMSPTIENPFEYKLEKIYLGARDFITTQYSK